MASYNPNKQQNNYYGQEYINFNQFLMQHNIGSANVHADAPFSEQSHTANSMQYYQPGISYSTYGPLISQQQTSASDILNNTHFNPELAENSNLLATASEFVPIQSNEENNKISEELTSALGDMRIINNKKALNRAGGAIKKVKHDRYYENRRTGTGRTASQHFKTKKQLIRIESGQSSDISQREKLMREIESGRLECLICCEIIKPFHSVWSCANCYYIMHLNCVVKWAASSKNDEGWSCCACQNITKNIPRYCYCFCGKLKNPSNNRNDIAHSCGDICHQMKTDGCPYAFLFACGKHKCM